MTVSYVGAQGAAATTVTIPAHQVGDLILIFAYRDGSNTVPTAPTAGGTIPTWTQIGSSGGNTNSSRFHYAVATATNTTSGTWTNATELICLVYRGASIGASAGGSGAATTSIAYPALTLQRTDNSSWVVGVAGHRTATNVEVAPTGMTNRASSGTEAAGHDTNGTVTSWSQQTVTVNASSAFRSWTVELRDKTVTLTADKGAYTVSGRDAGIIKGVPKLLVAELGKFFLPERNLARESENFSSSYWLKLNAGTGLAPVVITNNAAAPDGTITADSIVFDLNGGTSNTDRSDITAGTATPSVTGNEYIFSVWLKTTDGSSLSIQLSHNGTAPSLAAVTSTWQRFTSTSNTAGDTARRPRFGIRGGTGSAVSASLDAWGFQWEKGASITDYDPTGPAGATANDLRLTRRLVAEPRLFSVNSAGAGVRVTHILSAEARGFAVTGNNADLHVVRGFDFNADLGAITITRNDAGVLVTRKLIAAARTFSVVGRAATISKPVKLIGATRAFNITGIAADIVYAGLNNEKQLYYQSVQVDPRKAIITPGVNEDQLVYYVKGFYRIL